MYVVAVNSQNGRDKKGIGLIFIFFLPTSTFFLKLVKHFYESLYYACKWTHMIQAILSNVTLALNLAKILNVLFVWRNVAHNIL